jgi:phosphocarrier protein FPr
MAEATITVTNRSGLHARPAANFVRAASGFAADVRVTNLTRDPGRAASAKSMLGVLGLGVVCGDEIRLEATGADAEATLDALLSLIAGGLGEGSGGE